METDRSFFIALAELSRRYGLTGDPARHRDPAPGSLAPFELRCLSQNGEDGVIAEILGRIGVKDAFFVEFGIETGREGNCVFLADVLGWSGVFIEPDAANHAALERKYATSRRTATLRASVTPENVESLFERSGVPAEPDVLSIDVDGPDYWIWAAIESYRPRVLVIEYNASLPPGKRLAQPRDHAEGWDGTDYFGSSLDALVSLGARKGYRLVHTELCAVNAFFVRSDLADGRFPAEPAMRTLPNYFLVGYSHPPDPQRRPYVDVDDG